MHDPEPLASLSVEHRETVAYQLMAEAAFRAAALLGVSHPHFADLDEIGQLYDQRPSLRAVAPSGSPSRGRVVQPPLLRLLPPLR